MYRIMSIRGNLKFALVTLLLLQLSFSGTALGKSKTYEDLENIK